MSFKDHATYGPVTIIGMEDFVYLNQPGNLPVIALNKEEAKHLAKGLKMWIEYLESKQEKNRS